MKKFWKEFLLRGMLCAWCGPVIMCIIWFCLHKAGVLGTMEAGNVIREVLSSLLVAFVAAGITAVHKMEQLPLGMSMLIHMAVLYLDYLVIYLINDWLKVSAIWLFTVIFVVGFALIWLIIYLTNRSAVRRMNARIAGSQDE